jgi:hypothetical protein
LAWYIEPQNRVSLYWIAKKLSDDGIPTPRGKGASKSCHQAAERQ